MNNCILAEADDFKSCGMLMPPGCHVDNFWALLPAGIIGLLWDVGIRCVYVRLHSVRNMHWKEIC